VFGQSFELQLERLDLVFQVRDVLNELGLLRFVLGQFNRIAFALQQVRES